AMGLRQVLEGSSLADLIEQALRFLGGCDEDLEGVGLLRRVELGAVALEEGPRLCGRRALTTGLLGDPFLREETVAGLLGEALRPSRSISRCTAESGIEVPSTTAATGCGAAAAGSCRRQAGSAQRRTANRRTECAKAAHPGRPGPPPPGSSVPKSFEDLRSPV